MRLIFTVRQRQIFILKCREKATAREIGQQLGISEHTVKNHVTAVLDANHMERTADICIALARELTDVPD